MKYLLKLSAIILFIGLITSCETNDESLLNEFSELNSKQDVKKLNLGKTFNISKDVYNEFFESLIFENGEFVGAIYDGIEKELDDFSSDKFWGNFGISIRNKTANPTSSRATIFEGYKPRRGGCKANNRWICVIRDYNQIN